MASPQVTVRMDPELYKALVKLARVEEKTLADLTRGLIEEGLKAKNLTVAAEDASVIERLDHLKSLIESFMQDERTKTHPSGGIHPIDSRLSALILKGVRVAAASLFYARQAAIQAMDVASLHSHQIDAHQSFDSRKETISRLDEDSQSFAQWWVEND